MDSGTKQQLAQELTQPTGVARPVVETVQAGAADQPILPGPVRADSDVGGLILSGKIFKCPGALLEPGSLTKVKAVCGNPTTEFLCPVCWKGVSPPTRRAFNVERKRLRNCGGLSSKLMKELISQVITEAARSRQG